MMQQPDRLAFEDRVLAYLDGALDDVSSERLLAEVSADTEKQEIFAAHQELDKLIMTARVPLETPEETRRSIVAAIPGLTTYLPEFITTGTTVSLLATRWRAIVDFFTQTPLRTALSVGGAAAVLTTGVVVTKNIVDKNEAASIASRTHVERSLPATSPSASAFAPLTESQAVAANSSTHTAAPAHTNISASHAQPMGHVLDIEHERSALTRSVTKTEGSPKEGGASLASSNDLAALGSIPAMSAHSVATASEPQLQNNVFLPIYHEPRIYSNPLGITVMGGFGTRVIFTPPVDGRSQSPDLSIGYSASIRYPLSDAVNLMAEGGNASFLRIRQTGSLLQSYGALQHYRITTELTADKAIWTRLGAEYQFVDDASALTPFVSGTVGAAFTQHLAPSVGLGAGVKWYWSDAVKLIGSVVYDQTWTRREQSFTIPESAIVDVQNLTGGTVSNSAVTINLGLSTTF